jgi:hypothetical protein
LCCFFSLFFMRNFLLLLAPQCDIQHLRGFPGPAAGTRTTGRRKKFRLPALKPPSILSFQAPPLSPSPPKTRDGRGPSRVLVKGRLLHWSSARGPSRPPGPSSAEHITPAARARQPPPRPSPPSSQTPPTHRHRPLALSRPTPHRPVRDLLLGLPLQLLLRPPHRLRVLQRAAVRPHRCPHKGPVQPKRRRQRRQRLAARGPHRPQREVPVLPQPRLPRPGGISPPAVKGGQETRPPAASRARPGRDREQRRDERNRMPPSPRAPEAD